MSTAWGLPSSYPVQESPQNQSTDAMTYILDLNRTIFELCGVPAPKGIDGADLTPLFKKPGGFRAGVPISSIPRHHACRSKRAIQAAYISKN